MSVHVEPVRNYLLVFAALMVLTGATVGVAYFDFGVMNNVVAMGIAVAKASLVVMIFMNARHATPLTRLTIVGTLLWLGFMVAFTLADYDTRGLLGVAGK